MQACYSNDTAPNGKVRITSESDLVPESEGLGLLIHGAQCQLYKYHSWSIGRAFAT